MYIANLTILQMSEEHFPCVIILWYCGYCNCRVAETKNENEGTFTHVRARGLRIPLNYFLI